MTLLKFSIKSSRYLSGDITIRINDLTGKNIYTTVKCNSNGMKIPVDLNDIKGIDKGIYTICIKGKEEILFRKIVLL
jgi:hypothetical protein